MRSKTILGRVLRSILCALVLAFTLLPHAAPVQAAGGLLAWSEEGASFTTFGPNDIITIDTGTIEFVNNCPSGGVSDSFLATADIYIVPSGSLTVGNHLTDVAGVPNTIQAG